MGSLAIETEGETPCGILPRRHFELVTIPPLTLTRHAGRNDIDGSGTIEAGDPAQGVDDGVALRRKLRLVGKMRPGTPPAGFGALHHVGPLRRGLDDARNSTARIRALVLDHLNLDDVARCGPLDKHRLTVGKPADSRRSIAHPFDRNQLARPSAAAGPVGLEHGTVHHIAHLLVLIVVVICRVPRLPGATMIVVV